MVSFAVNNGTGLSNFSATANVTVIIEGMNNGCTKQEFEL